MIELRILLLEDNPSDAELNERELRKAGLVFVSDPLLDNELYLEPDWSVPWI